MHVISVEHLPAIGWLLSGGFQPYGFLPERLLPMADVFDRLLAPCAGLVALRALITIERPAV